MSHPDFIIIGAGPAGAALSSRLAHSLPTHTILLLEAGGPAQDKALLFDRYTALRTPGLNYGYQSEPQDALDGRAVDYSRGKGLGGTSLINFGLWNRGAREDWDEIARRVEDEGFGWENVKRVFERVEGQSVRVEGPKRAERHIEGLMRGVEEFGWKVNGELNSGDPIGVGVCPGTSRDGWRVTAKTAYLSDCPANLEIRTAVQVARVLVEEGRTKGVVSVSGEMFLANKEVILSAGALDSPKLLLLSGLGPAADLNELGIPVVEDLPGVGQNLQDHCHFPIGVALKDGIRESALSANAVAAARVAFAKDGSGPLNYLNGSYVMGFLKDESLYASPEFQTLDQETQAHLRKSTVPAWELSTGLPLLGPPPPGPPRPYLASVGVLMNPQSRGSVRLRSADATEPALFDPKLMTHAYDQRVLMTAAKSILDFLATPSVAATIEALANVPKSEQDEDVVAFVKANLKSTWHMSGTCKMGTEDDHDAVVDAEFKVHGVVGLRVVDLSVLPFLINAHPVGAAYVLGEIASETVSRQYSGR